MALGSKKTPCPSLNFVILLWDVLLLVSNNFLENEARRLSVLYSNNLFVSEAVNRNFLSVDHSLLSHCCLVLYSMSLASLLVTFSNS